MKNGRHEWCREVSLKPTIKSSILASIFKVNNGNTRTMCEIYLLFIKFINKKDTTWTSWVSFCFLYY